MTETHDHTDAYTLEDPGAGEIDARPAKELFIFMLTKDISLIDTINDLVDNSIDGAKRLRGKGNFKHLWIHITANKTLFEIEDNCGGIEADIAKHYAFRFGRPSESKPDKDSVGLFGVGMKRAFFKLSSHFRVESSAERSSFELEVDVADWIARPHHWGFPFVEDKPRVERFGEVRGTKISLTKLNPTVGEEFASPSFIKDLSIALRQAQQTALANGLVISLNKVELIAETPSLLLSQDIKPIYIDENIEYPSRDSISKKIYIGLGKSSPTKAGWYVYCNGRLVVDADKSITTGWGADTGKSSIPDYHNQFAQFRGYVFLESADPTLLPYNTTKSGIDESSPMFRALRSEMVESARPVIDFLNELKEERENQSEVTPLFAALNRTKETPLDQLHEESTFVRPAADDGPPPVKRISFTKPTEEVNAVMEAMNVTSAKVAGERAFDYYYRAECL